MTNERTRGLGALEKPIIFRKFMGTIVNPSTTISRPTPWGQVV